jgi:hypothetical protein
MGLLWFINPVLTWDNSNTRIVYGMCFSLHCEHGRGTTLWYNVSGLPRRDGFWGGQCVRMTSSFTKNPQVWMVLEVFSIHLFLQDWKRRIWCDMQRYALETLQTWLSLRLTCLTLLRFQPHRADRVPFFGHGATVPKGADVLFKKELAAQLGQPGWDGSSAVRLSGLLCLGNHLPRASPAHCVGAVWTSRNLCKARFVKHSQETNHIKSYYYWSLLELWIRYWWMRDPAFGMKCIEMCT